MNRISAHGYTWYKGKLMTGPSQYNTDDTVRIPVNPNPSPGGTIKRCRMTCITWNCNGLNPARWDLLQQWLSQQTVDLVNLQETKWPFSSEWIQQQFYCIHTGCTGKQAGLMTLVWLRPPTKAGFTATKREGYLIFTMNASTGTCPMRG